MAKKSLIMLVLALVVAGGVFAQTNFALMPKNTVTVDVGPTVVGLLFGQLGNITKNMMGGDLGGIDLSSSGFGIAAQYERQVLRQLGIAGRLAYLGMGMDMGYSETQSSVQGNLTMGMDITTISAEAHARFYPGGNVFFLGGMAGYGYLSMGFNGRADFKEQTTGQSYRDTVSFNAPRNYAKVGARLGWRIDFGRPGGFVFEPSFGYDHAFGLGDSILKQLENKYGELAGASADLEDMVKIIESYVLVGGPRVSLAFGWRF